MKAKKDTKETITINTPYGSHRVIFERDARKGYVATAQDLPGVSTWGKDLTEAKKMICEAIELCVECIAEERIAADRVAHPVIARRQRERVLV